MKSARLVYVIGVVLLFVSLTGVLVAFHRDRIETPSDYSSLVPQNEVSGQAPTAMVQLPARFKSTSRYRLIVNASDKVLEVHAYDKGGRHTGPASPPALPRTEALAIDQQIPGVLYQTSGNHIYLNSFANSTGQYVIKLIGKSAGTFTLNIEAIDSHFNVIATLSYRGGGVTSQWRAELTVRTDSFTTYPELIIDSNGDGRWDTSQVPSLTE